MASYAVDVPAEMPVMSLDELQNLRDTHKRLVEAHRVMRAQLAELLQRDCKRLEYECKDMADTCQYLRDRSGGAETVPGDFVDRSTASAWR